MYKLTSGVASVGIVMASSQGCLAVAKLPDDAATGTYSGMKLGYMLCLVAPL